MDGIIGRDAELAAIERTVGVDPPRTLLLEGDPGIGKTTLWRAGVELARGRGLRVVAARPAEAEAKLSFAALGDLLGELGDEVGELPPPQRRALRVALLLDEPSAEPTDLRALGVAVETLLLRLDERGPLLVAVDDLQWLDEPSRAVLEFAGRRLEGRVRMLLAARPGSGWPGAERVAVAPLERNALAALLRRELEANLQRPLLAQIERVSGGNPLYALELGRAALAHEGPFALDEPLPVPETLHGLVASRLDAFSAATRAQLLRAAALGRVTGDVVAAEAVAEAVAAAVLTRSHGELAFAHPLFASVLYDDATREERRAAHAAVAPLATDTEERARHLAAAADEPDEDVAVALAEAARHARARGAPEAAAELAERAVRLTPPGSDSVHARLLAASSLAAAAGDLERAAALADEAVGRAATARERVEALRAAGDALSLSQRKSDHEEVYERALAAAGADLARRASLETRLSRAAWVRGDLVEAERRARVAVELAEQAGDSALLVDALVRLAIAAFEGGRGVQTEVLERAIALGGGTGWTLDPRVILANHFLDAGQFEAARPVLEELLAETDAAADFAAVQVLFELCRVEFDAGNWPRSHEYVERGLELALQSGRAQAEIMGRLLRARHFTHRGEVEVARADLERGLALAEALLPGVVDLLLGALGRLELAVGDAAAAHARLAPVTEHVRQREWIGAAHQRLVATDAEALVELGELDAARELADLLERQKALDEDLSRALTASLRGLIAAAAGDLDTAAGELRRSLAEHEQTRQPFNIAYTLLALGTVERRARRNVRARESLERALAIFEELGARLHAERAQAELARVGGRRPAAGKLTETERRVAELVARGKSNQEVARELYVSPKTVEWNLSKVYRKLMIRSRGELAAKLAGEGARKIRGTAD